jgi:hypothetical protein
MTTTPVSDLRADDVVPAGEKRVHLLRIELRRTMHIERPFATKLSLRGRALAPQEEQNGLQ